METQKHFVDADGNHFVVNGAHFVAPFDTVEQAESYTSPEGAEELPAPPSPLHVWSGAAWVAPEPVDSPATPEPTPQEKLAAAGLTVDDLKALLGL